MASISSALRIGHGTDRHRLSQGVPLYLGGVLIEISALGAVAHSDGDVVLHALIDALLSTVGLGDIGDWFPPSDPQWKDADSTLLLEKTLERLKAEHPQFQVINTAVTVHLEKPKLKGYKLQIKEKLAEALSLPAGQVSVQAKTAEGIAPVGTSEVLDASVVVLVSLES